MEKFTRSHIGCVSSHYELVSNINLVKDLEAMTHLNPSTTAGKAAAASSSVFDGIRTGGRLSSVSLGSWCLEQPRLCETRIVCHILELVRFDVAACTKRCRFLRGRILRVQARVGPQSRYRGQEVMIVIAHDF
jgi:hypothetical protein